jgi:ketosteroid isomerase-like protein
LFLGKARPETNNRATMRRFAVCLLIALGAAAAFVRAESPGEAVKALVDAERNFFHAGQEKGTRAAFLEFLARDGIVFQPGPVNGQDVWSKRADTGFDLVWEPTFAAISRSADFGYDTGPAKWRAKKTDEKFTGHGYFVSIWKKQKDGSWKVALDCGMENPQPTGKPEPLKLLEPDKGSKGSAESLQEAQNGFLATAKLDFTKAFRQFGSDEVRIYRYGSFPTLGKEAGAKLLGPEQAGVAMEVMKSDMSSSADLAYTYGSYLDTRTRPGEPGHFLQVWQTDASGAWKLVLDWQRPLPPPK